MYILPSSNRGSTKRWVIFVFSLCRRISSIRGKCAKIAKVETLQDRLSRVFEFQVLGISARKKRVQPAEV